MSYRQMQSDTEVARALGWASIGIGLTELAAPRQLQTLLGIEDRPEHRGILRVLGIRELLHGVGILTERKPSCQLTAGMSARVAGDVLDTAVLGAAARKTNRPVAFAAVTAVVLGVGLLDAMYSVRVNRHQQRKVLPDWSRRGIEGLSRALAADRRRGRMFNGSSAPNWKSPWR